MKALWPVLSLEKPRLDAIAYPAGIDRFRFTCLELILARTCAVPSG